jgi:hypothetical protein
MNYIIYSSILKSSISILKNGVQASAISPTDRLRRIQEMFPNLDGHPLLRQFSIGVASQNIKVHSLMSRKTHLFQD